MKAVKLVLLASVLIAGLNASANTNVEDCSQIDSGNKITRDDRYTNPKTIQLVKSSLGQSAAPAQQIRSGQDSKVTGY